MRTTMKTDSKFTIEANGLIERAAKMATKLAARARKDPATYGDAMGKVGPLMAGGHWEAAMKLMEKVMGQTGKVSTKKSSLGEWADTVMKAKYTRRYKGKDGKWRYEYPGHKRALNEREHRNVQQGLTRDGYPQEYSQKNTQARNKKQGLTRDGYAPSEGTKKKAPAKSTFKAGQRLKTSDLLALPKGAVIDYPGPHGFELEKVGEDKWEELSGATWSSADVYHKLGRGVRPVLAELPKTKKSHGSLSEWADDALMKSDLRDDVSKVTNLSAWADQALNKSKHFAEELISAKVRECLSWCLVDGKADVPDVADRVITMCAHGDFKAELKSVMGKQGKAAIEALIRREMPGVVKKMKANKPAEPAYREESADTTRAVMAANGLFGL